MNNDTKDTGQPEVIGVVRWPNATPTDAGHPAGQTLDEYYSDAAVEGLVKRLQTGQQN